MEYFQKNKIIKVFYKGRTSRWNRYRNKLNDNLAHSQGERRENLGFKHPITQERKNNAPITCFLNNTPMLLPFNTLDNF